MPTTTEQRRATRPYRYNEPTIWLLDCHSCGKASEDVTGGYVDDDCEPTCAHCGSIDVDAIETHTTEGPCPCGRPLSSLRQGEHRCPTVFRETLDRIRKTYAIDCYAVVS